MLSQEDLQLKALEVNAKGHTTLEQVYAPEDIQQIEQKFDALFRKKITEGKVQSRDWKRFTCKLPLETDYLPILNNKIIHSLLIELLGEDYVLFNANSHSALPGSSKQIMHYDSLDSANSDSLIHNYANVAFLHIPLMDTTLESGGTEMWPATIHKAGGDILKVYDWVLENTDYSNTCLKRGDVVIKLDNCVHAGGKNTSEQTRHIMTLVFARKDYYLNYNSGMIPGGNYSNLNLPYSVSAHCPNIPNNLSETFEALPCGTLNKGIATSPYEIRFKQFSILNNACSPELIEKAQEINLESSNDIFNLVQATLPLANQSFLGQGFSLHSVKQIRGKKGFSCDEKIDLDHTQNINIQHKKITIRISLTSTKQSLSVYPGSKNSCISALKNTDFAASLTTIHDLSAGDIFIASGILPYELLNDECSFLELSFVSSEFEDDSQSRLWVSDTFALGLPKHLSRLLRYNQIYITQEDFKDFKFRKSNYLSYVVFNQIEHHQRRHPVSGNILKLLAGLILLPVLLSSAFERPMLKLLRNS